MKTGAMNCRIGMLDATERLIREDDTKTEGIVMGVALPHGDRSSRIELLGERRKIQSARPAPDNRNSHVSLVATVKCRPS